VRSLFRRPATCAARAHYLPDIPWGIFMRSGLLWLIGIPIPIIIVLWLITGHA
jgi:hypothetical protein